jgi:hypothetical protein
MPPPAATQAAARLWTQPTPSFSASRLSYRSSVEVTRTLWWQTRFTRWHVREWKSGHNSVTVQNRTHVYMNFFYHKDQEITSCSYALKSWNTLYVASIRRPYLRNKIKRSVQILRFWTLSIVLPLFKHDVSDTGFCTSSLDWTQLSTSYWWERLNLVSETFVLDKDKTMDSVQERNICTNVPSSQTFRSYLKEACLNNRRID